MNTIPYPKFLQCCSETENVKYINILEDAAMGISSKYIKDINSETFTDYNDTIHLYKNLSTKKLLNIVTTLIEEDCPAFWSDIRKKDDKDTLIERFVVNKQKEYSLSLDKVRELYKYIMNNMYSKNISSENIVIRNGDIFMIEGIQFDSGKVNYKQYDVELNQKESDDRKKDKKRELHSLDKFLDKFNL